MTMSKIIQWFAPVSAVAAAAILAPVALSGLAVHAQAQTPVPKLPVPQVEAPAPAGLQTAVFAGGCFWGLQGVYEHVRGVRQVVSGYAGGQASTAHYEVVSTGLTGHAESIKVTYDPRQVSYGRLLQVFFSVAHDPTQLNRQDPDDGSQYRSEIWVTTPEQKREAVAYMAQLQHEHAYKQPIVTKVEAAHGFYPAEAHHQDFLVLNPENPYIATYDMPKIEALRRLYPDLYRAQPVRVGRVNAA